MKRTTHLEFQLNFVVIIILNLLQYDMPSKVQVLNYKGPLRSENWQILGKYVLIFIIQVSAVSVSKVMEEGTKVCECAPKLL